MGGTRVLPQAPIVPYGARKEKSAVRRPARPDDTGHAHHRMRSSRFIQVDHREAGIRVYPRVIIVPESADRHHFSDINKAVSGDYGVINVDTNDFSKDHLIAIS